ncbi:MAG: glycosyltransferase [Solirubrobacterales bacterium]
MSQGAPEQADQPAVEHRMRARSAESSEELIVAPVNPFPTRLAVGRGQAFFVDGTCSHPTSSIRSLEIRLGDVSQPVIAFGMARPFSVIDSDYWWAILTVPPVDEPRMEWIELVATLDDGSVARGQLETVDLLPRLEGPAEASWNGHSAPIAELIGRPETDEPLVAVCMATYNPPKELFGRQIDSIRAQTHRNWVCLISDDGSDPEKLEEMRDVLGEDRRFLLSVAEHNSGFYRNFERALSMVPSGVDYVALSDQDDQWRPEKLATLLESLGPEDRLAYSDMRIVDEDGEVISDTYWNFRQNNHTDFASLVLANTVTGAASLFDRKLLPDILPFPPATETGYHDHWIAQVAMALGGITYVDRPLYDYVQHRDAYLGHLAANAFGDFSRSLVQRAGTRLKRVRIRKGHMGWRIPYFRLFCRVAVNISILRLRCGDRMTKSKRRTLELISDSPGGLVWLGLRSARSLNGRTATLGRERVMFTGLVWRRYARLRRRARHLAARRIEPLREQARRLADRGRPAAPYRPASTAQPIPPAASDSDAEWLTPILVDYFTRDGSTLMMRLLGSSPQIAVEMAVPYERKYFAYFWRWAQLVDREDWPEQQWGPPSLGSLTQVRSGSMIGPPPWIPRPLVRSVPGEPSLGERCFELAWSEFSRRAIRKRRDDLGLDPATAPPMRYFAEKHMNTWKVPLGQLPPLKLIVLLRDPRDSWVSINAFNEVRGGRSLGRDRAENPDHHLDDVIRRQRERLRWIAKIEEEGEVPVVRYDDLVLDLSGTAARLGSWLGVEFDTEAVLKDKSLRSRHMTADSPEKSVGRWRDDLEPEIAERISRELAPELRAVGIEP